MLARCESLLRAISITPRTILEAGCGNWETRPILLRCFPNARLVGVDLRPLHLTGFVQADIRALPFKNSFDLLLIRHPNIHRSRETWQPFLSQVDRWLSPGGMFLITVYSAAEAELMRAWLPPLKLVPIESGRLAPVNLAGQDRYFFALSNAANS